MFSSIKVEVQKTNELVCTIRGVKIPFSPNGKVEDKSVPIFRECNGMQVGEAHIRVVNFAEGYAILDFDIYKTGWDGLMEDAIDTGVIICRRLFGGSASPYIKQIKLLPYEGQGNKECLLPIHSVAAKIIEVKVEKDKFKARRSWKFRKPTPAKTTPMPTKVFDENGVEYPVMPYEELCDFINRAISEAVSKAMNKE